MKLLQSLLIAGLVFFSYEGVAALRGVSAGAGTISPSALTPQANNTVLGNTSGSTASPVAIPTWFTTAVDPYTPPTVTTNFFSTDTGGVNVWNIINRGMVGYAAGTNLKRAGFSGLPGLLGTSGTYIIRDAQLGSVATNGGIGIGAMTQASLNVTGTPNYAPIAISGLTISDLASETSWAGYLELQAESVGNGGYGLEIDTKNKGANSIPTPYGTGGSLSTPALWLAAGGDSSYGGSPANPSGAAIIVVKSSSTWNKGIVFSSNSLTGDDGTTGTAEAIQLAKGHQISWYASGGLRQAQIRSDSGTSGHATAQVFADDVVQFFANGAGRNFQIGKAGVLSPVNFLEIYGAVASSDPNIEAAGSDTNINIGLLPKGTGVVKITGGTAITGTKFTTSGCSISSTTGGATAGTFTLGANSCTAIITMNGATGAVAPNGWTCQAHDRTAPTVLIGGESSSTTTTASITIPAGAGTTDVISFSCIGY